MEEDRKTWPRDTVIIHQIGRAPWTPSFSPFPLKLETYCRMAKIPHIGEHKHPMSSKSKTPWITYNDEDVADSHFSIQYLNKKFNVDLNSHLTSQEKATGRAFQSLIEDHLYWILAIDRWVHSPEDEQVELFGSLITPEVQAMMREGISKQAYGAGIGRHSVEEIRELGMDDLSAVSVFLGDKKFLFGDEPCEFDATVFGMLAQVKYHPTKSSPYKHVLNEKFPNLSGYVDRMKERFWPDWDDYITHGHTKPENRFK